MQDGGNRGSELGVGMHADNILVVPAEWSHGITGAETDWDSAVTEAWALVLNC